MKQHLYKKVMESNKFVLKQSKIVVICPLLALISNSQNIGFSYILHYVCKSVVYLNSNVTADVALAGGHRQEAP